MIDEPRTTPLDWMRALLWLLWRIVLYVGLIVGGVYGLGRLRIVIIYVVVAVILAYIMRPIAKWFSRKGVAVPRSRPMHVRRAIATLYVLVLFFVGLHFGSKS